MIDTPPVPVQLTLNFELGKRWRTSQQRWVVRGTLFDPRRYGVDVLAETPARRFVEAHHYSGTWPSALERFGLYRCRAGLPAELVGVAAFSRGANEHILTRWAGVAPDEGAELGRFVLLDDVPFNGESWALARVFDALCILRPGWRAIVSKADPLRIDDPLTGRVVKQAHWGTIYQASNAAYVGASCPRTVWIGPDNRVFSERALCKIRRSERGAAGATQRLVALGADPRHPGEDPGAWLDRVLRPPLFRTARHPGTLTYVFGLTTETRQYANARAIRPYPRGCNNG